MTFNATTGDFSYQGNTYNRLSGRGASEVLRQVLQKVYNTTFAGATRKLGLTNCIEFAQGLVGKGVVESLEHNNSSGTVSAAIIVSADGLLGDALTFIKLPKHSLKQRVIVTFNLCEPMEIHKHQPAPIVSYKGEYYWVSITANEGLSGGGKGAQN